MRLLFMRFVLWAFERFYHEGAWTYDTVAWLISRGYWERWATIVVPELHTSALLDLGCGTGFVQRARIAAPQPTVGLDESWPMLRRARRKVLQAGGTPRLVRAVGQHLPFQDQTWPVVLATFPAPYLFAPQTLREIQRVLAPAGRLLIVDSGTLPSGWYARMVHLIYAVVFGRRQTDQSYVDPRVKRLEEFDFEVARIWHTVGKSQVEVLEARYVG